MPALFVHGVPDTHHLWDGVRSRLARKDTIALSLPGFGVDAPQGFGSTKEEYVGWLTAELERIGEPVDLVGHDWGALLTERVACLRPDLLRTWAAGGGAIDEGYVWHSVAVIWQTPGQGEQFMLAMTPAAMATAYVNEGVPEELAREFAARVDDRMKAAILPLYRSAVNVWKEWSPDVDGVDRPGLVIWGKDDPFGPMDLAQRMAKRAHAEFEAFEGCSHWWPASRATETAAALEAFWAKHDAE
jgi:pimeloyl-ACP methyl ester carboxylesterase